MMIAFASLLLVYGFAGRDQNAASKGLEFVVPNGASSLIARPLIDSAIAFPTRIVFEQGETAKITVVNMDGQSNRVGPWVIAAGQ